MFLYPRPPLSPLYNYSSWGKTSAGSGHRFITWETRHLYLSAPCCPRAELSLHNYGPRCTGLICLDNLFLIPEKTYRKSEKRREKRYLVTKSCPHANVGLRIRSPDSCCPIVPKHLSVTTVKFLQSIC